MKTHPKNIIIFLLSILLSCSNIPLINKVGAEKLDFPEGNYWRIGWLNNRLIAFVDDPYLRNEIKYVEQSSTETQTIAFDNDPECPASYVVNVQSIYNNKIQLNRHCFVKPKSIVYLQIFDWETKTIKKTIGPVPLGTVVTFWNPDETFGLVYLDDRFAKSTLYMMTQDDFGPFDLILEDEGKSWNFSEYYPDLPDIESTAGDVGRADWSPNGNSIVFFASPDAVGKSGTARMEAQYKIYAMDIDTKHPQAILDSIYHPYIIKWSPDSNYLAFIGGYENSKNALWIYTFEDASITQLDQGIFEDILWDPDSRSLIAIKCSSFNCKSTDILKYDISAFIN